MFLFPIYPISKDEETLPQDDICYLITKKGLMLKKKVGIVESLTPVKEISILGDIPSYGQLHIPKIPGKFIAQTAAFFKEVYKLYASEAIVLIYFDEIKKKYKFAAPIQKVSAGTLNYDKNIQFEGYTLIGSIHSHGSMGAFHSGVDDNDEQSFDGIHITLGNVSTDNISFTISSSIVINGMRFEIEHSDYIENIKEYNVKTEIKKDIHPAAKSTNLLLTHNPENYYTNSSSNLISSKNWCKYFIDVNEKDYNFPKVWLSFVEKITYTNNTKYINYHNYNNLNNRRTYYNGGYNQFNNTIFQQRRLEREREEREKLLLELVEEICDELESRNVNITMDDIILAANEAIESKEEESRLQDQNDPFYVNDYWDQIGMFENF